MVPPEDAGTDLEGEFSNPELIPITLKVNFDSVDGMYRSRFTIEDFQASSAASLVSPDDYVDARPWTKFINPLFIVVAWATYP